MTKDGVKKLVNDLTIDAEGIRQITQQETTKIFNENRQSLKGERGKSSYIHKKYSDNANGANMDNNPTRQYIGIYTGEKETPPENASEYSWTKIRGNDGINGRNGQDGRDGKDGLPINENLLPDSNFSNGYNKNQWADNISNSGLNANFEHAKMHFGRGLHIWGTPNNEYQGLSSRDFNLVSKQGDKLTFSVDLGKDALTANSILQFGLHYLNEQGKMIAQEWQSLDLATQGF